MLREYQRELNDSVWPGGITLHQEAHFYTTSPLSPLLLIYPLAKLQPFQFRPALKHAAYMEGSEGTEGKTQIRAENLQPGNVASG